MTTPLSLPVESHAAASSRNACKLCTPLGACFVFRGVEGAVPLLHGSQGCSTYIRRYMISHFREPVDIASSNFAEASAIFGGQQNLRAGLLNVIRQYAPRLVGIATTCLAETIGDDVRSYLRDFRRDFPDAPPVVHVATPSYSGTHVCGFHEAVRGIVDQLAPAADTPGAPHDAVNLLPGMVSPADLRYLKEIFADFRLPLILLPDYSDTLDGQTWTEYHRIPDGGTPVADVTRMAGSRATIQFHSVRAEPATAGRLLQDRHAVPCHTLGLPIGIRQTDAFFKILESLTGRPTPPPHAAERGRLIDAYVDAHKHLLGLKAVVYGEADLVVGLASFLAEVGVVPILCATGEKTSHLARQIAAVAPQRPAEARVVEGVDFLDIETHARALKPDLIIGASKGYALARKLDIPLLRVGFPVHDRIGGARILHMGYRGAQQLFDSLVNEILEKKQQESPVGYTYL
ncbi:MAG: hypothetical protein IT443_05865 [Phycisphaeraceae bacterium]|nr:hypothetical protein [Phycisphaeraceae bacterium]